MAARNEFSSQPETLESCNLRSLSQHMSKNEKLYLLHNEIAKVTNSCLQKNISYIKIRKAANSFMEFEGNTRIYTKLLFPSIFLVMLAFVIALASYVEPTQRYLSSFGRRSMINMLPLVDWISLHGVNCFIPNYYGEDEDRPLLQEDCQNCSSILDIDVLQSSTMEEVASNYLYKDIPVIVINTGRSTDTTDMKDVMQLYLDDDVMRLYMSCQFESNIIIKRKDHRIFLENIRDNQTSQYYAHWENCFKEAAKLFRQLYKRPEVLPTSVELTPSNWIFVCNNFTDSKHIMLPYEDQIIILIQLSGSLDIRFRPREPCTIHCKEINTSIPEGSTLFVPDFFYDIEYVTCNHGNSITVGLGGRLDI